MLRRHRVFAVIIFLLSSFANADSPRLDFSSYTRYMALGDSLSAGYGAQPATRGFVYLLYQNGVIDKPNRTLLSNAGVPSVTSAQLLAYQVPQAVQAFKPTAVTLTVGGNDLLSILQGANPGTVLASFQANLVQILGQLRVQLPDTKIYISNLYTIPQIPGANDIVPVFNAIVAQVASGFGVPVADVYGEFLGRSGLLLIERPGASPTEAHPTNAGYRAMARAFAKVIKPGMSLMDD
jgi:lysophospholipase L1-like esterase